MKMAVESEKKVIFITGGSRGLGKTMVKRFAEKGCYVFFTYRKERDEVQEIIESSGGKVYAFQADASLYEAAVSSVKKAVEIYGKIDVLINNAFSAKDSSLENSSFSDFKYTIDNVLFPVYNYTRATIPYMISQRKGKLINIGSVNGIHGREGSVGYSTAKAGIIGFTKTAAKELGKYLINCNVVAPGYISTDGQKNTSELIKKLVLSECYIKKLSEPEAVSSLVEFLASDQADNITGQVFQIDCGQYI